MNDTKTITDPTCSDCGAQLVGTVRVNVDTVFDFSCPDCADKMRDAMLVHGVVHVLETGDETEVDA